MRAAASAAVTCAALLAGCEADGPSGLNEPRVVDGSVERVDTDRLARTMGTSIDFVSAERGFLATQGDVVLRTGDGGETWAAAGGRIHHIADLDFVTARRGYALTGRHVLIATRDAGDSWQRVHRFPYPGAGEESFLGLDFVDSRHGWVAPADGWIYRTTDAGNTWTRIPPPCRASDRLVGPTFVDRSRGYAVCAGRPGAGSQSKSLHATSDGGESWRLLMPAPGPVGGYARQVEFRTASAGLILTARGGVDVTRDGGRTWRSVPHVRTDEESVRDVAAAGAYRMFVVASRAGVLRTDDGGRHWRRVFPSGDATPTGPIAFFSRRNGIAFGAPEMLGGSHAVLATSDGGRRWKRRSEVPLRGLAEQVFRFGSVVLATDGRSLARSADAGRRWNVSSLPADRSPWLSFVSSDVGYLADEARRLFRTEDGGVTWTLVREQTRDLYGVVFVSEQKAFIVDYGPPPPDDGRKRTSPPPRLLESLDGGASWRPVVGRIGRVTGISRLDDEHWWLFASLDCNRPLAPCRRQIWRTTDGGRHGDLVRLPAFEAAGQASFASPKVGYVGSPTSGLYRTGDGGVTWSYVYPG